jgi:hypothetical protein
MARDDPGGVTWPQIQADLRSLQQLTEQLSDEVSYRLHPAVSQLFDQYQTGVGFGAKTPSADIHAVKRKYYDCLCETMDRLAKYVIESGRLVDVANVIVARYQSADALASASLDEINQVFLSSEADSQGGG